MPRFVLLYHECPPHYERTSHWDFMLEDGDILRTWAIEHLPMGWHAAQARTADSRPICPAVAEHDSVAAVELADHRLAYLQKEGPLSGNRGSVSRIDDGTYVSDAKSAREWQVTLSGQLLRGQITLRHSPAGWTLTCNPSN